MSSTYTQSLQIQLIGNGEQAGSWGSTTNVNWQLIEDAVAGVVTITMSDANYTLTTSDGATDEARNMVLIATGTNTASRKIVAPLQEKVYLVVNNTTGGYDITVGGSTGSTATIPNGTSGWVFCNGTNFYNTGTFATSLNVTGNLTVGGTASITGNTTVGGTFGATGNTTVGGNLTVTGTTTLTGNATAPTQSVGDNSTKIATTAFVQTAVPSLSAAYPIGSIYMNASDSTNPATLFGFGTWVAVGAGRMLLGNGGGYAAGATGGSATTTISASNLPAHTHSITDPGHNHSYTTYSNLYPQSGSNINCWTGTSTGTTGTSTTGITATNNTQAGGTAFSNTAMTTISPYLVVYMWVRTA